MNHSNNERRDDIVFSRKVKAGKRRTYFFDVRRTRGDDYFVTLTESNKRHDSDRFQRHKIFLYKEDFNRFVEALQDAVDHVKTELMPDFDYDEFTRRQEEYEQRLAEENGMSDSSTTDAPQEDDMSW